MHSQTRVFTLIGLSLYIPMGRGLFSVMINVLGNYILAAPFVTFAALTDDVTTSTLTKMLLCVLCSSMASIVTGVIGYTHMYWMDWRVVGEVINKRAHADKT